jgi:hypothetical protein
MLTGCLLAVLLQVPAIAGQPIDAQPPTGETTERGEEKKMSEEEVLEAREQALGKLDKPLEKMKIGELMALLKERGVACKNCKGAEKSHIVAQVREAIHLPKKEQGAGKEKNSKGKKMEAEDAEDAEEKGQAEKTKAATEMSEEEVAAAREEALGKLDKPLEKMKIGELMALLKERGVACKNCKGAEKSHIVAQVREAIHLPKKESKPQEQKTKRKEDVDDLMSKLKGMPGMENIKVVYAGVGVVGLPLFVTRFFVSCVCLSLSLSLVRCSSPTRCLFRVVCPGPCDARVRAPEPMRVSRCLGAMT